ncbi:MAG: ASKHA domain-containing protein [Desulfuromonadia bacterium]
MSLHAVVDLGTTTVVVCLVSAAGDPTVCRTIHNPQREYGLDVVTRLGVARSPEGGERLCRILHQGVADLIDTLLGEMGIHQPPLSVVVAGNTAMQTIFLNQPVDTLVHPPFRPRTTAPPTCSTAHFGWRYDVPLIPFPQPGGFVGGDLTAFLWGVVDTLSPPALLLDIGTNAEIALVGGDLIRATSAAAGPAFEGGNLSCGTLSLPGGILRVTHREGRVSIETQGGVPPTGLAGSGAVSLLSLLRREGVVDRHGSFVRSPSPLADRLEGDGMDCRFVLYRDASRVISLTQEDVRQLQLAIAAVRAGVDILLDGGDGVDKVVITGSFGGGIDPDDLETLGLIDPSWRSRLRFVRDGVIRGLVRFIREGGDRRRMESFARRIRVIPLSGTPRFEERFIRRMTFPDVYGIGG